MPDQSTNHDTYECLHCGAFMGIVGTSTSSPEDVAADDYYDEAVRRHESGECVAAPVVDPRVGFVAGLRALADLIDATPDLPLPSGIAHGEAEWVVWPHAVDDVPTEVARLRRLLPGQTWTKNDPAANDYTAKYYELSSMLQGLTLKISTYRDQVCERVVTGTREVTEDVPVAFEQRTTTVEDVEWVCKPLLAEVTR